MGWVIVEFPECREVLIDDKSQGDNRDSAGAYRVLFIEDGQHTFCLRGAPDCRPVSQTIVVGGTSILVPLRIVFTRA